MYLFCSYHEVHIALARNLRTIKQLSKWTLQFCTKHSRPTRLPCNTPPSFLRSCAKWRTSMTKKCRATFSFEGVDSCICHSLRDYLVTHPHALGTDIASKTELTLAIQNGSVKTASSGIHAAQSNPFSRRNWNKLSLNVVKVESPPSPTRHTHH